MPRKIWICALALVLVLTMLAGCSRKTEEPVTVTDQIPVVSQDDADADADTDADAAADTQAAGKMVQTTLYFLDGSGYTVPVTKTIPWEEGIAKATLTCLIDTADAEPVLQAKGLKAPLHKGTVIDLDIADTKATVDVKLPDSGFESKEQEAGAIAAIVNTLLHFPTVKSVSIMFNGQKVSKLPNGTAVEDVYTKALVNAQPKGVPTSADGKAELYYTNAQGQVLVPVYQALETNTPAAALAQMLAPAADSGLSSLLPDGCKILSVTVESDGTAKVDLSKEFEALSDMPSVQTMAIKAILLTCQQFEGVEDVDVLVEGQPLEANVATMAGLDSETLNTYD